MAEVLCQCGCGQIAPLAKQSNTRRGYVKGQPMRFLPYHRNKMRTRARFIDRWRSHITPTDPLECWEWVGDPKLYPYIRYQDRNIGAHVATYRYFKGDIPVGMEVRHTCDNRRCCNPNHLLVGTRLDNVRDMDSRGRRRNAPTPGGRNGSARLTVTKVLAIRRAAASGVSQYQLAAEYGVGQPHISSIVRRESWRHV